MTIITQTLCGGFNSDEMRDNGRNIEQSISIRPNSYSTMIKMKEILLAQKK